MQLHVKGKNLEVSDSMRSYVERKLQKLDRRGRRECPPRCGGASGGGDRVRSRASPRLGNAAGGW